MKKIYSFTIVLVLVFMPLQAQTDQTFAELRLSLDLGIEKEGSEEHPITTHPQDLLPFLMAIELILLESAYKLGEGNLNKIPKYLSALPLMDIIPVTPTKSAKTNTPSYVLNAGNSFENTFFPWLKAVDFKTNTFQDQQQYDQGFGPRIRI